ncbi:hypothetical protein KP509_18G001100 [Ceratopteris richardii]|uniref:UBX domain-containing protein n=1 Tax=Ceratopteris richardii TaxID=49495 RepID=A0A8T2SQN6_CERRI|nr:hypothetical protein KP509_18G001100 [Ceratopteris richardii]
MTKTQRCPSCLSAYTQVFEKRRSVSFLSRFYGVYPERSSADFHERYWSIRSRGSSKATDAMFKSEDADTEEEILRSVIEESKKETSRKGFSKSSGDVRVLESPVDAEDTDLAQAISLSLKTAEQERAWRESGDCLFFAESDRLQDDTESDAHLRRRSTHLMRQSSCGNLETSTNLLASDDMIPDTSVNSVDAVVRDSTEEAEGFEGQLLQRRRSKKILKYPLCSNTHGTEQLVNQDDLKKVEAANQSVLPEEPPVDSDCAVTIMVRLPNGARQIRQFRKSEPLQCLFDFIDISCGVCSGSYQLVSSHPRRVFSSAEGGTIFRELGLNSKYETLFLEML